VTRRCDESSDVGKPQVGTDRTWYTTATCIAAKPRKCHAMTPHIPEQLRRRAERVITELQSRDPEELRRALGDEPIQHALYVGGADFDPDELVSQIERLERILASLPVHTNTPGGDSDEAARRPAPQQNPEPRVISSARAGRSPDPNESKKPITTRNRAERDSHSRAVVSQAIAGEYTYAKLGLILGLASIIGGVVLGLHGVAGTTSWTAKILGLESKINDAAPGVVLFIVGLFMVLVTRPKIDLKNLKG
jgi:hypothetical protein